MAEQWVLLDPVSIEARNYFQQAKKERKAGKSLSNSQSLRSGKPLSNNNRSQCNSIYVGNLPLTMSDFDLRQLAIKAVNEKHLEEAYIIKDQETGKSRGFGFIVLSSTKSSARSIDQYVQLINGTSFKGRVLQARRAYPKLSN